MAEKCQCIEPTHPSLRIKRQCELIGLPRASYYRGTGGGEETAENLELMRLIDEEYTRHPFCGSRQIRNWPRRQGHKVNRKRVQRLIRKMGLVSVAPKPDTNRPAPAHKVYPYLLRGLEITRPNQVWCADITYIRLAKGFVYLTAVMDWHSRYVLSWEVSVTMERSFASAPCRAPCAVMDARGSSTATQGSQFTGDTFTGVLKDAKVDISMDGKGRAMDNIMIERLWRSVKYEEVYLKDYENVSELVAALRVYFELYNYERPHQSHAGRTPAKVYRGEVPLALAA